MAKQTSRLSVKGELDLGSGTITEYDKNVGEIVHDLADLMAPFDRIEDVTLTLSFDRLIDGRTE